MSFQSTIGNEHQTMAQIRKIYPDIRQGQNGGYEILLQLQLGALYISVYFPKNFPNSPPTIFVASPVEHPLVGDNQKINYPEENVWSPRISLLNVIKNVHQAFMRDAPRVKAKPEETLPNFTEILNKANMPIEDEEDLREVVFKVPKVVELSDMRDRLLDENITKSDSIIYKKAEIEKFINNNRQKISEIEEMTNQYQLVLGEYEKISSKSSENLVIAEFKRLETRINLEITSLTKKFMSHEISTEEYIIRCQPIIAQSKFMEIVQTK